MSDLRRRVGRLEAMSGGPSGTAPDEAEWRDALETIDRYYKIWGTPKLVCETLDTGPLPMLCPEDRAFVEKCETGALVSAEGIDRRYREAQGLTIDIAAVINAWLAEAIISMDHRA